MLNTQLNSLREALPLCLQAAISSRSHCAWHAEDGIASSPGVGAASRQERLEAAIVLSGALSGMLVLTIGHSGAHVIFGEGGDLAEAWLALVRLAGERLCIALASTIGTVELQGCHLSDLGASLQALLPGITLRAKDEHTAVEIGIAADRDLLRQLQSAAQPQTASTAHTTVAPQVTPLHRVIDVPLAVTLRFGQRRLTLRDVLELKTGSLLELDRQVEEAVDLMLGERVIARGEVVIIDGNYGMRVTEVLDVPDRTGSAGQSQSRLRYGTA